RKPASPLARDLPASTPRSASRIDSPTDTAASTASAAALDSSAGSAPVTKTRRSRLAVSPHPRDSSSPVPCVRRSPCAPTPSPRAPPHSGEWNCSQNASVLHRLHQLALRSLPHRSTSPDATHHRRSRASRAPPSTLAMLYARSLLGKCRANADVAE